MSERLVNFPPEAIAVPAAELRTLADMLVAMSAGCAKAAAAVIERLDEHDGDPEAEDDGNAEPVGDETDVSWLEWRPGRRAGQMATGQRPCGGNAYEDDEPDGDETDGNGAEDEEVAWFRTIRAGPGCTVSDSDRENGEV